MPHSTYVASTPKAPYITIGVTDDEYLDVSLAGVRDHTSSSSTLRPKKSSMNMLFAKWLKSAWQKAYVK